MTALRSARCRVVGALGLLAALGGLAVPPAGAAATHALIQGSGSSWAANAVAQWVADVTPNGLQVVFTPSGSAQGRQDFANKTTDFAVSDIGYQGRDPLTGASDTSGGRAFAYLPIVAGGTSFPYQIKVAGKLVKTLRLSGRSLARIFTNQITDWNDAAITADNNGVPVLGSSSASLPIVPVVHSEGSGATAQFTQWMVHEFPDIWSPFAGGSGGFTEYFPVHGNAIAQNGSDPVMNFVASAAANGSIGYDEYSYPLAKGFPVAKIGNAGGYYNLPTQYNVAVSLTQAVINQDKNSANYLLQDLAKVYSYNDPRTYPLSSYSYALIPTAASDARMTTAKRQTLADYLFYSICAGQKEMGPIGYSPLPINLVTAGFAQIGLLGSADPGVNITQENVTSCNNPTFVADRPTENHLADIAPQPAACDQSGQGPCGVSAPTGGGTATGSTGSTGAGSPGTGTGSAGTGSGNGTSGTSAGGGGGTADGSGSSLGGGTGGTGGTGGSSTGAVGGTNANGRSGTPGGPNVARATSAGPSGSGGSSSPGVAGAGTNAATGEATSNAFPGDQASPGGGNADTGAVSPDNTGGARALAIGDAAAQTYADGPGASSKALAPLSVLLLLAVMILPPWLVRLFARTRRRS